MSISVAVANDDDEGKVRIVRVSGEVDLDSSPALWRQMQQELREARCLKVDLRDVSYIDSSGIAILIQGFKHASKSGTGYRLLNPSPRVMAVLEMAQLPRLFDIESTEQGE